MLLTFASCDSDNAPQLQNQIAFAELSDEQLDILGLIHGGNVSIFEFNLDEAFTKFTLWIDVYRYGEFIETLFAMELPYFLHPSTDTPYSGRLAIMQNTPIDLHAWDFAIQSGNATARHYFRNEIDSDAYGVSTAPHIIEPMDIRLGDHIILMARTFGSGIQLSPLEMQTILTDTEIIAHFPLVYIVRVRFS